MLNYLQSTFKQMWPWMIAGIIFVFIGYISLIYFPDTSKTVFTKNTGDVIIQPKITKQRGD